MQDTILILDQNSALSGLIARTLRGQQIYSDVVPMQTPVAEVLARAPKGIILAAEQNWREGTALPDLEILSAGIPVLSLGHLTPAFCVHYGGAFGAVIPSGHTVTLGLADSPLFEGISGGERMLHRLQCVTLPEGLRVLETATEQCIGFQHSQLPLYALQYPIESNDPDAVQLLTNFACHICRAQADWDEDHIVERAIAEIRKQAGDGQVLCAVSGGVDSAVCAKLAHMAVGNRLICVFVDTGLFRAEEAQNVVQGFHDSMGLTVEYVDAQEAFLNAMGGMTHPGDKERIASALLHQILVKKFSGIPDLAALVLGSNLNDTLYGSEGARLPQEGAPLPVVEPVRALFKEEVRRLARTLMLPAGIVERQPFPSSGLALRIMGQVTAEKLEILRKADAFFAEAIYAGGYERRLWQFYATLSENPDRPGSYAVLLRALHASRGCANAARLPFDLLERVSEVIRAEVPGVTRVVYDLTPSMHYTELE